VLCHPYPPHKLKPTNTPPSVVTTNEYKVAMIVTGRIHSPMFVRRSNRASTARFSSAQLHLGRAALRLAQLNGVVVWITNDCRTQLGSRLSVHTAADGANGLDGCGNVNHGNTKTNVAGLSACGIEFEYGRAQLSRIVQRNAAVLFGSQDEADGLVELPRPFQISAAHDD